MLRTVVYRSLLPLLLLIGMCGVADAQTAAASDGDWVMSFGKRTLMVLSLKTAKGGALAVTGSLAHPRHFSTSDGASFSHISGEAEVEPILASEWKGDSLRVTVGNPVDAKDTDAFLFRVKDATHATLQFADAPWPPMEMVKAVGVVAVSTDWDTDRAYSTDDNFASNAEMKRLYDEDQRVRQPGLAIDWKVVSKSDAERRTATKELLKTGALHTGEDFTWAAFLFQHGETPEDYLLAHTLAMVAVKKGRIDAVWIATATLDRYLQSIQKPQIYGTQFLAFEGKPETQEPYDRGLVSDALRKELGVPSLAAQEEQRKSYDAERKKD